MPNWLQSPEDIQSFMGLIETYLQADLKNAPSRGYTTWHPSAFGKCLRKMMYQRYSDMGLIETPEQKVKSNMIRLWALGHDVQARWERYFTDLGILRGVWQCKSAHCRLFDDNGIYTGESGISIEKAPGKARRYGDDEIQGVFKPEKCICGNREFKYHEVAVRDKEMNLVGHADMVLDFSRLDESKLDGVKKLFNRDFLPTDVVVVDLKTCNQNSFRNKVMKKGPDFGYQVQLTIYANLLDCSYGILIYECKNDSLVKAFHIPRNADTWFKEIRRQALAMNVMVEKKKLPPPRPCSKKNYECDYCEYSGRCFASDIWGSEELGQIRRSFYGKLLMED